MAMRPGTADPYASSHAGRHGDFSIRFEGEGWFLIIDGAEGKCGPYATSQAAFCAIKEAIDKLIETGEC